MYPRDRALGLHDTSLSPATTRMVGGWRAGERQLRRGERVDGELAGVAVDPKQVERTAEALGREVAADERERVGPAPGAGADDVPGIGRHRRAGAQVRGGRSARQPARWTIRSMAWRCALSMSSRRASSSLRLRSGSLPYMSTAWSWASVYRALLAILLGGHRIDAGRPATRQSSR